MKPPRFISAGNIPVQVNPRAVMATGAATAAFGQTIAAVGDMGLAIAHKVRLADEAAKTEDLFSQFELEANKFTIGLMTRQDSENWPDEWASLSNQFKEAAGEKKLSPDGMGRFQSRFQDWNTRRTIHLETVAANKTIETANATFANSYQSRLDAGDYGGAEEVAANWQASGLKSAPEIDALRRNTHQAQQWNGYLEDIRTDPNWLDNNPEPPPGMDEQKYNQLKNFAQSTRSERNRDGADGVLSNIITGTITKPEEIDERADLSPIVRHTLKEKLLEFQSEEHKRRAQSPEGIQAIVGQASSLIKDYDPADKEQADAQYIRIASAISQLPSDSPIAKELTRQANAIRSNTWQERDTVQSAALGALDDAFKAGRFGASDDKPTPAMSTDKAINDGFLRDKTKLSSLGYSEEQIAELYAPVPLSNGNERPAKDSDIKARFQKLWEYRAGDDSKASPFARATARAIVDGETDVIDLSPEAQGARAAALDASHQKLGKMKIELSEWLTRNPKATEAEVTEKVTTMAGATARDAVKASLLKPRPTSTSTSYTMPSKGIKLANYGYASDTTGDSYSARGIGHSNNKLIPGKSAAISKSLADKLNLSHGDKIKIKTTKGDFEVFYHDTVPATDKRTGPLPPTIDIYRPQEGSNSWGGRVLGISKL